MLSDVRQAWRSLRRSPGFALVTIGTLVLGIGVTVGMFSVLEGLLLRPLPFKDPEQIVRLWESNPAKGHERFDVTSSGAAFSIGVTRARSSTHSPSIERTNGSSEAAARRSG